MRGNHLVRSGATVAIFSGVAITQTIPATAPVAAKIETYTAFREWWYECKEFPNEATVRELATLPDDAAGGEALYWKSKARLHEIMFRLTIEEINLARRAAARSASLGFLPAKAEIYRIGLTEKQYKDSEQRDALLLLLGELAKNNVPDGAKSLGRIYRDGDAGMPINLKLAQRWFQAAIKLGDLGSWVQFAITQDRAGEPKEAIASLTAGADVGDPEAAFILGTWYADGHLVTPDPAEATRRYRQAADRGFAPAQLALAKRLRADGDLDGSGTYATRAAARGMPEAITLSDELALIGVRAKP